MESMLVKITFYVILFSSDANTSEIIIIFQRRRQRVRSDCSCPGVDWRSETCGNSCQNGGTPRLRDCSCPVGFKSDCCETSKLTCSPAYRIVCRYL